MSDSGRTVREEAHALAIEMVNGHRPTHREWKVATAMLLMESELRQSEARLAKVEAETVERCAKVADKWLKGIRSNTALWDEEQSAASNTAEGIAADIRALNLSALPPAQSELEEAEAALLAACEYFVIDGKETVGNRLCAYSKKHSAAITRARERKGNE